MQNPKHCSGSFLSFFFMLHNPLPDQIRYLHSQPRPELKPETPISPSNPPGAPSLLQAPLRALSRTSGRSSPTAAWNDRSGKSSRPYTSSPSSHRVPAARFPARSSDTSLESDSPLKPARRGDLLRHTSNSTSNSYFSRSWMYQHLPNQRVPSLLLSSLNQSLSAALLFCTYWKRKHMFAGGVWG